MRRRRRRGTTLLEAAVAAGLSVFVAAIGFGSLHLALRSQGRVEGRLGLQEELRQLGANLRNDLARSIPGRLRISPSGRTLALKIQRPAPAPARAQAPGEPPPPLVEKATVLYAWGADVDGGLSLTRRVRGPQGWEDPPTTRPLVEDAGQAAFARVDGDASWLRLDLSLARGEPVPGSEEVELVAILPSE